jgi:glycerophosphoryl diester phosphodiesterase
MTFFFQLLLVAQVVGSGVNPPIVIAHRGASGYAVEHTEAAKAMAYAQGSDYIEQDVVLSKDEQFIVTHDITMEETTDVEQKFSNRSRPDGRFYFADFDWSEISQLTMHERTKPGSDSAAMERRFPGSAGQRLLRLEDEIRLVRGWNQTTGKSVGLYIELKGAAFHKKEFGRSMGAQLMKLLSELDVQPDSDRCFIQCFEPEELKYLREKLDCKYPLIQLLGRQTNADTIADIAKYAKGIGPTLELIAERDSSGVVSSTGLVESAHAAGLLVHPYTVRKFHQPKWSKSLDETHAMIVGQLRVDGFFTDYPDLGRSAVDELARNNSDRR